jgi:hypothetical protein
MPNVQPRLMFLMKNKKNKKSLDNQQIIKALKNFSRGDRIRTCDPLVPNQVRYQLRYAPEMSLFIIDY